jgi:hypothetical protein
MNPGELVFASVADGRVWQTQGRQASSGVYTLGVPGRALPFTVYRAWKVPTGMVNEEIRFIDPSGRTVHVWGPAPRRMKGSMDLTEETDVVDDATFAETGVHLASFILDGQIVGELEFPVFVQQAPAKLPQDVETGLKKSDVLFVGIQGGGSNHVAPVWFAYKNGRILVLSQREPGPQEQTVPGIPGASEVLVITRRKQESPERRGRDTALGEFHATVRVLEGAEWEDAAKALADRRRSRFGSPQESIARWRDTCAIAELTPLVPA